MSNVVYDVYLGVQHGIPDHHAIWVDTGAKTTVNSSNEPVSEGILLQVTGNTQQGMSFEEKTAIDPVESFDGKEKIKIGTVRAQDLDELRQICREFPPPPKQFNLGKKIDPEAPLYHCQHWVRDVIGLLRSREILRN